MPWVSMKDVIPIVDMGNTPRPSHANHGQDHVQVITVRPAPINVIDFLQNLEMKLEEEIEKLEQQKKETR